MLNVREGHGYYPHTGASMQEKTIHSQIAFKGRFLTLEQLDIELEDGRKGYREIIRHPGAIGVVARLDGDRFVLVQQYRKAGEAVMTEVVAGLLDPGEDPVDAAHRELAEETGYSARSLVHLGTLYASPGYVDERVEIYLAELDPVAQATRFDHDERVATVIWSRAEWATAIRNGVIRDAKTLAAWAMLIEYERAGGAAS